MYVLITYDVNTSSENGQKRLRQVAKCCKDFGQRVQNSVFECLIDGSDFVRLKAKLLSLIDKDLDSIRIYQLGKNYQAKIEHLGVKTSFDMEGELII
ncbi:MAG: CRISPR-associated endonuclease Cas2 [Muribaculaceae bacterium]|nr:CRISPR-associated endonuclease Cas2 [Muribaculaceae bacterium]